VRILTIGAGVLMTLLGIFSIANSGLSFMSLAFVIGIVLILVGMIECFSYKKSLENEEEKHWLLIEGMTTFILGVVVLTGQLAADIAVPVVFGMWIMISGIRGFVILTQVKIDRANVVKDIDYYWDVIVSTLNLVLGLYTFFNNLLYPLSVLAILGLCFVVQGATVIKVGYDLTYVKPTILKTKEEMVEEEAHREVRRAIRKARHAKRAAKKAEKAKDFDELVNETIEEDLEQKEQEKDV
jgi:uncharacterized membrane protein HdeD (DUF308 family)